MTRSSLRRTTDVPARQQIRGSIARLGSHDILSLEEADRLARLSRDGRRARRVLLLSQATFIAREARRRGRADLFTSLLKGFRAVESASLSHPVTTNGRLFVRTARQAVRDAFAGKTTPARTCDEYDIVRLLHDAAEDDAPGRRTTSKPAPATVAAAVREAGRSFRCPSPTTVRALINDHVVGRQAYDTLVRHNIRLVIGIAKRFQGRMPLDDLISEGIFGLMIGLARFDPERGFRISTYVSWWIEHRIHRALADTGRTIRIPAHLLDTHRQILKIRRRSPGITDEQVASEAGIPLEKIQLLRDSLRPIQSLEKPIGEDGFGSLGDVLADESARVADDDLQRSAMCALVVELIDILPDARARDIIRSRYFGEETLRDVGKRHNLCGERIRQLEEKALDRLRLEFVRMRISY